MTITGPQRSRLFFIADGIGYWYGSSELKGAIRAVADSDDAQLASALIGAWNGGGWEEGLAGVLTARSA